MLLQHGLLLFALKRLSQTPASNCMTARTRVPYQTVPDKHMVSCHNLRQMLDLDCLQSRFSQTSVSR